MGTHKMLLPFGGETVIAHVVDELLRSRLDAVHVVVGFQSGRVVGALSGRRVSIAHNANYKSGMLSSVRCGLESVSLECEAVLVALGDQPSITAELVDEMMRAFKDTGKGILVPVYRGSRGHPLLFSISHGDEILTNFDDVGLRGLLHAHPDEVFELAVSSAAVLSDMDYPEDYRRELASLDEQNEGTDL
jgi:molybdenum cofactor cytidylyltransferase